MKGFVFWFSSVFPVIGLLFALPAGAHDMEYDPHSSDRYYDCYYDRHRHERVCYERRPPPRRDDSTNLIIGLGLGLALHHGLSHYKWRHGRKHAYAYGGYRRHGHRQWRGRHFRGYNYRHHGKH